MNDEPSQWEPEELARTLRATQERVLQERVAWMQEGARAEPERHEPVNVVLTPAERAFTRRTLLVWGSPARMSDSVAHLVGYEDAEAFDRDIDRLIQAVDQAAPLHPEDWKRVLVALEFAFGSYLYGGAWDWNVVTGIDESAGVLVLRAIQTKLAWLGREPACSRSDPR